MTGLVKFARPVIIQISRHGKERIVVDVTDAASILMRDFGTQTIKRRAAMDVCLKVLRGEAHSTAARGAFVTAAREANILRGD
ncbi:DUF982 domain-containing protein [Mesorhizobium sp. M0047]|uniref:DUF982 domain-containing protein n=1 Tax=unclassified Mesorhizobium TaxID=325217 RepID=UPI0033394E03